MSQSGALAMSTAVGHVTDARDELGLEANVVVMAKGEDEAGTAERATVSAEDESRVEFEAAVTVKAEEAIETAGGRMTGKGDVGGIGVGAETAAVAEGIVNTFDVVVETVNKGAVGGDGVNGMFFCAMRAARSG